MKRLKNVKLDSQSSASIVLAVIVAFFMGTMFLATNSIGKSFALPSSNTTIPDNLATHLESMNSDTDLWNKVNAMINAAGLEPSSELFDAPYSRIKDKDEDGFDLYCLDRTLQVGEFTFTKDQIANTNYRVILFLLEDVYRNNVSNEEYYSVQHAIWYYLASNGLDTDPSAASYVKAIDTAANNGNELARDIKGKVNNAIKESSRGNYISVANFRDLKLVKSEDGKYLESSDIIVQASPNLISDFDYYTVTTGDSSIELVRITADGYEKIDNTTQLENGQSLRIRIPIEKESEIGSIVADLKIAVYFNEEVLYYYLPPSGYANTVQRVLYVNSISKVVPVEESVHFVKISKQDVTNNKEIPGASLKLDEKNIDGSYYNVTEWVSSDSPRYIYLPAGEYRLTETIAPEGYELSSETITFTVADDNKPTQVIVMYNTPYVKTPDTAAGLPLYIYVIGTIILVIGTTMVYTSVKVRKN